MTDLNHARALRARVFALASAPDPAAQARLWAELERVDLQAVTHHEGLALSPYPSSRFCLLRFLEAELIDASVRPQFACPLAELPSLAAAFIDPQELSFRNFENIIGLDHMIGQRGAHDLRLSAPEPLAELGQRMKLLVSPELRAELERLGTLELYTPPFNTHARGGQRYIFHCAALAELLAKALRSSLPKAMLDRFVHVNPVFRCSRFAPGDARFWPHVDGPYYDPGRGHVSKYTLLIYLTGGRGDATLRIGDLCLDSLEPMTAIVFDQRLVHEGGPFDDGDKILLRSELIFEAGELAHSEQVGMQFAKACYLSSEALFTPQLVAASDAAFNAAAAAHWHGVEATQTDTFVHKHVYGIAFITNGYDYWFARASVSSLAECAALAVLDAVNATIGGEPFRKLCDTEVLVRGYEDGEWIRQRLLASKPGSSRRGLAHLDPLTLFPQPEEPDPRMSFPMPWDPQHYPDYDPDDEEAEDQEPPEGYGKDIYEDDWDAERYPGVIEAYTYAQEFTRQRLFEAPIAVLGSEVFIAPDRFVIAGDKIHVLCSERPRPLHFANFASFSEADFLDVEQSIDTLQLLVPPISFRERDGLVHLNLDLFRNTWMVDVKSETVHVPKIIQAAESEDYSPWVEAHEGSELRSRAEDAVQV
jgi:hypothetical protein